MSAFSWRRKIMRHFSSCFWFERTRSTSLVRCSIRFCCLDLPNRSCNVRAIRLTRPGLSGANPSIELPSLTVLSHSIIAFGSHFGSSLLPSGVTISQIRTIHHEYDPSIAARSVRKSPTYRPANRRITPDCILPRRQVDAQRRQLSI